MKVDKDVIKSIRFTVKLLGQDCLSVKSDLQIIPIYEADVKEAASRSWYPNARTHQFGEVENKLSTPNKSDTEPGIFWCATERTFRMTKVNRQEKMERKDFIREKKYFFVFRVQCQIDIKDFEPMFAKVKSRFKKKLLFFFSSFCSMF